ncbi:RING finger protein [Rasamsonia emersonii CBS 393.64]|uniref:RBR-type E3 ubiquitin transferase n=1 Tax=Rasamsonia emersonii (strain ATCC 16479 / CBS 393.64 / IMI 116815) TaxID=1408163 RepID=A0A0F4YXP9_RASE3|nr:RING finger protein [Rasamsonia emersonii CBS 393.64]KKA23014.1 RING finger protein [Rasamsonia emersonii CBS 393.64]
MESDDDFMTDVSSHEEDGMGTQGSDEESIGEGTLWLSDDFGGVVITDTSLASEDFGDDFDTGFSNDKDIVKKTKKPYEVDFKVLSPADIEREQNQQINEVSQILGLPPESTAILLRFARWNREKLIESYMEHPEETLEEAGLGQNFEGEPKTEVIPGFMCSICCEDGDDLETYAMRCGHRFCVDCFRQYLAQKIKEEGEAARIQCPQDNCHRIVDSKSLNLLVTDDLKERYQTLLTRTYVDDKENLKWCPAPNCEYAIDCPVKPRELNRTVPTVQCACSHSFCFGCSLADHQPPPCSLVKMWLKKCEDDSETANWIAANTKECPKCHSTIEKNGGCNHMTCRKCKHEFCWMCMGLWSEHGTSWYNCNRYEEKSGAEARDAQARSRASLERYLHYYNRYANHEQSAKLDKDLYLKTEKKMTSLQSQSGMSWIEVQFLSTASQALQQCRQTLKWTYAFAYYLARNNLTEIFEDNQKDLEMAVESLSEMFEKPISELAELKVDILDKTAYCNKRRIILLSDTAENLKNGEWEFNVKI